MPLIRPNDLEDLARRVDGRDKLGELIRRLIWSWVPNRVQDMSFLSGEENNMSGWDGWVHLRTISKDSPEHFSVWQISVEKNPITKIKRDFSDFLRTDLPPGWQREKTIYVAATLRKLDKPGKLAAELKKRRDNPWADVKIVDSIDLAQMIEKCPCALNTHLFVALLISRVMRGPSAGHALLIVASDV